VTKRPSLFKQRDITRAIRAARAAGVDDVRVEIEKNGKLVVIVGHRHRPDEPNPWD